MDNPLRILHLDDDWDFTELVTATLHSAGLMAEVVVVADLPAFVRAIGGGPFDIIFADYVLPTGNGIEALQAARRTCPDVPFVLISGAIEERVAIEILRAGATDYVLKTCLDRLEPVVRRAVHEARERVKRKFAETELIRRERYFRTLTENSLDILTIVNAEGVFQYNSPSVKSVVGYEPKDLDGESAFVHVHPDDLPGTLRAFGRLLRNPDLRLTHEFRFRHRNGIWCHLESVGQNRLSDPEIAGVVINSRDVTDRRQAEAERRESEKQYRLIFDASPIPMWLSDTETLAFLEINEAAVQKYGFSRQEFLGMTSKDILPSEEVPRMARHFVDILSRQSHGGIGHAGLWRHRKNDGSLIDVEITWSVIIFKGREALLTMASDVTERRKTAEALEKSEASLATAQRIAHLGSWEFDLVDGEHFGGDLRWSDETYRIYGYEPRSIPVTPELWHEHVHRDDRQRVSESASRMLRDLEPYDIEHRIVLADGAEKIVRERAECVLDLEGRAVQVRGIVMDLTERKRLEEQLRQSQKMEAIGQLAGGVAHDFNNILTVIQGHASLLLTDNNLGALATKSAQQINQAAERAAGLTRQLLTFGRRQTMRPRRLDLNEVVSNMSQMLERILGEDIALQIRYSSNRLFIQGDASMMEQVLLNLAVNARDALPSGGQLSIEVSLQDAKANGRQPEEVGKGRMVCLTVKDNGSGIAPENLKRIFEPFFTTKEVGKGTGLGLATVYGIVKQHQGWIEVDSQLGKGSTFAVFLPEAEDNAKLPESARAGTSTAGTEGAASARLSLVGANARSPERDSMGRGNSRLLSVQERDEQNAGNGR